MAAHALGARAVAAVKGLGGETAIRLATACGAANCLAEAPGRVSSKDVKFMIPRVKVHRIRAFGGRPDFLDRSENGAVRENGKSPARTPSSDSGGPERTCG